MVIFKKFFLALFPYLLVTLMFGTMYAVAQQVLRMGANDPQVQKARDVALAMSRGELAASVIPLNTVEVSESMSPFLTIFDQFGKVIGSSVTLRNKVPVPPMGVFEYAKAYGENRFTWQPESGVRIATVINSFSGDQNGFVLVGRSLTEVEGRVNNIGKIILMAWIVSILGIMAAGFCKEKIHTRRRA
jgi:hypothetical protein